MASSIERNSHSASVGMPWLVCVVYFVKTMPSADRGSLISSFGIFRKNAANLWKSRALETGCRRIKKWETFPLCRPRVFKDPHQLWIDVMQRAEVTVEVCYVEELGEHSKNQRTMIKKRSTRSKPKQRQVEQVDSDWETPVSEWEQDDELDASQTLQEDDLDLDLVRKRSAEDTSPNIDLEKRPAAKRMRTELSKIG